MYLNVFDYAAGASLSQSQKIAGSMQHHDSIRRPWMESYWASADPESDDGPGTESLAIMSAEQSQCCESFTVGLEP